ncbi:MAG TPA: CaiB/BaiF CoA-transferase family protein [Steroidobacteraceae bacterium]|nr:CaiB/BaiF CoA-transferase family protein [Steroidobacteraceae bacterium]
MTSTGPLAGLRIVELASIGPGPYCGMLFADLGAEVLRVERDPRGDPMLPADNPMLRGRTRVAVDVATPAGRDFVLRLIERCDGFFEGMRPGVAERLGIGPEACLERNPRLVYGRVTGWGQEGPLSRVAGHDLNYVALSGLLHLIGPRGGKPVPPLNAIGDFAGGGLWLAFGMVCALLEAQRSGRGQVVDAAMIDGVASFLAPFYRIGPEWSVDEAPGESLLAGAAHYYDTYETADGKYISIAAIEPKFYAQLIERLGLDRERFEAAGFPAHGTEVRAHWMQLKSDLEEIFRSRTRAEWCDLLEGTEVCFAPVLAPAEAPRHPHHQSRGTFVEVDGIVQNAPGPRFSRTRLDPSPSTCVRGLDEVLHDCGIERDALDDLLATGVIRRCPDPR